MQLVERAETRPDDAALAAMMEQWPALTVDLWPIEKLVPYARNARTHSEEQVAQIAGSIKEWGWTMPVLVDEAGGIIAGHGRVLAGSKLGLAQVPVATARGWSEAKKRAYILADNKLALNAGWDNDLLKVELQDLLGAGVDLGLAGFDASELDVLLNGWSSDIDPLKRDGENLDGIKATIRVEIADADAADRAKEVIAAALKEAGIAHELG